MKTEEMDQLIFNYGNVPGSNIYTTQIECDELLTELENKYSEHEIKRFLSRNEKTWCSRGFRIKFSDERIAKYYEPDN